MKVSTQVQLAALEAMIARQYVRFSECNRAVQMKRVGEWIKELVALKAEIEAELAAVTSAANSWPQF